MLRESNIAFESGKYWVLRVAKGFEVYRTSISATHSTRCAIIGYEGLRGLNKAKEEIVRRQMEDAKRAAP